MPLECRSFIVSYSHQLPSHCGRKSGESRVWRCAEATAEVETTTGTVVQAFTSGTMVQVFLLARRLPAETWSGSGSADPP